MAPLHLFASALFFFSFFSFFLVTRVVLRESRAGHLLGNENAPPPFFLPYGMGWFLLLGTLLLILAQSLLFYLVAPLIMFAALEDGGKRFGWTRLSLGHVAGKALLICAAFLIVMAVLTQLSKLVLEHFHWPDQDQEAVEVFRHLHGWEQYLIFLVQAVVLAPFMEELFFRGFLFPFLKNYLSTGVAIIVSAALFGFVHLNLASFVPLWAFGIVLALTYEFTGSLPLCMAIHGLFNLGTALALLTEKS